MLVITTTWPRTAGDSTPAFVADLSSALSSHYEIEVVTPRRRGTDRLEQVGDVTVHRFWFGPTAVMRVAEDAIVPMLRRQPVRILEVPFFVLGMVVESIRSARRLRPDVVHAHWALPCGAVALLAAKVVGARVVITVHGADVHALQGPGLRKLKRFVFRRADAVTTVSEELKERVVQIAAPEKIDVAVVPMGVDASSLRGFAKGTHRQTDRVVFVGRLAEKKGVPILLVALQQLAEEVNLHVVGDGPMRGELVQLCARLGVEDRVKFLGALPRHEVAKEIASAAVLAIPSVTAANGDKDGTPVVLGESVALGTAVVASDVGGLSDYLTEDTGWLVPEGNSDRLAFALTEALSGRSTKEKVEAATEVVLPQLSVLSIRDRYIELFSPPES